jgi:hypothetical protein
MYPPKGSQQHQGFPPRKGHIKNNKEKEIITMENENKDVHEYKLNETLATEIIGELKAANKRIFVALMVACAIICMMIGIIAIYLGTPSEQLVDQEEYTVSQDADIDGNANEIVGVSVNEQSEADGDIQKDGH